MNKIDKLIKEKCPNGVKKVTIDEVIKSYSSGLNPRQNFKLNENKAELYYVTVKEITTGKIIFSDKTDRINKDAWNKIQNRSKLERNDILLSGIGTIGKVALVDIPVENWNCSESVILLKPKQDIIFPKYLVHLLRANIVQEQWKSQSVGSTLKGLRKENVLKTKIFLPPLELQKEIVKILDKFCELETELETELKKELEVRKNQYEFWRKKLLNQNYKIKYLPELSTNLDNKRKPVTKGKRESGEFPYYGASGIVDYVSNYIFDEDLLLISEDGANLLARSTPIAFSISGKVWVNNHAHVLKFENKSTQKYVEHYLNMIDLSEYITGAAQPKLNQDKLNKISINIPESLIEQEKIVNILDKFEKLINDISEVLLAEIKLRRKQYEYYRNKLLSFEGMIVNE